ncbi:MAG: argininosuccinate lyase [Patescibacteria group bacterium]
MANQSLNSNNKQPKYSITTLWGKAFDEKTDEKILEFTAGRDVHGVAPSDFYLIPFDIWGSKAHCIMLEKQGIINKDEAKNILSGLLEIEKLFQEGKFELDSRKEDVHTNIEIWLINKYGIDSAGKLHTSRSRNDQTIVDIRMYLRSQVLQFLNEMSGLVQTLLKESEKYIDYSMPGFTHHQHAMVTTFGHTLIGYAAMITRDMKRLQNWHTLNNTNSLGSGAGYGTSHNIDQDLTTKLLAFDAPEWNSMDRLTNRWEPEADLGYALSVLMNHLSGLSQTLILLSTPEFGMVELHNKFSTGSSIMPQKKNPDPLEVVKAKSYHVKGLLQGLLGIGSANFIGYNRDSQWSKYIIMDIVGETKHSCTVMSGLIKSLTVNKEKMEEWASKSFVGVTNLLEYLTFKYHIPFRKAKMLVEEAIKNSSDKNILEFSALNQVLKSHDIKIDLSEDMLKKLQNPKCIIKNLKSKGSPNPEKVKESAKELIKELKDLNQWTESKNREIKRAIDLTNKLVREILN